LLNIIRLNENSKHKNKKRSFLKPATFESSLTLFQNKVPLFPLEKQHCKGNLAPSQARWRWAKKSASLKSTICQSATDKMQDESYPI